jgi:hypothetical protein
MLKAFDDLLTAIQENDCTSPALLMSDGRRLFRQLSDAADVDVDG